MENATNQQLQQDIKTATAAKRLQTFPPLATETRSHVDTSCAAFHLSRRPQTLRAWACFERGAVRPVRIMNRLAWSVADIRRLLNGGAE